MFYVTQTTVEGDQGGKASTEKEQQGAGKEDDEMEEEEEEEEVFDYNYHDLKSTPIMVNLTETHQMLKLQYPK